MSIEYKFSISKALTNGDLIPLGELTERIEYPVSTYISRTFWERPDIRQDEERLHYVLKNQQTMTSADIESGNCGEYRGSSFNPDTKLPLTPYDWARVITGIYRVYPSNDGGRFLVITVWDESIDRYVQPIQVTIPDYIM